MKVYRSKSDKPKKKFNKKAILSIGVSVALIAAALAITLTLTLNKPPEKDPEDEGNPVVTTPVFVMPVDSYEIGKEFSNEMLVQYKTSGMYETHEAIDFIVASGTKVKAIYDGTVLSIDVGTTMEGTVIKIQHSDGVVSVYKGLSNDVEVSVGDTVEAGDVIGTIGVMTIEAREYDQPHLHLEVLKNGNKVNPAEYLPEIGDK